MVELQLHTMSKSVLRKLSLSHVDHIQSAQSYTQPEGLPHHTKTTYTLSCSCSSTTEMVFNSNKFLVSQGWEGQGKALKKGGRARPISVVQKKTMSGVGKDTYNGFEWWDALFSGTFVFWLVACLGVNHWACRCS